MSEALLQFFFSLGTAVVMFGGGIWYAWSTRAWKKTVEKKLPVTPSEETLETAEQELREKISLQVGVQFGAKLDEAEKRIKKLETDNAELKLSLESFKTILEAKNEKIDLLNGQVSRIERQHEKEESKREQAEDKYHKAELDKMELATELKVYRASLGLIQDSLSRPINITLSLDGIIIKEVKTETPLAIPPSGEITTKEDSNPS